MFDALKGQKTIPKIDEMHYRCTCSCRNRPGHTHVSRKESHVLKDAGRGGIRHLSMKESHYLKDVGGGGGSYLSIYRNPFC
jgi:hypothetical protein